QLLREQRRVYGYRFKGYWGYTRTIEEYWQTSMDLLGPEPAIPLAEWGIRTNLENRNIRDCQPMTIGPDARVSDSLIYNGCIVEGTVERSILFPGVHVRPGAQVRDSVLFFDNIVGRDCRLHRLVSDVNNTYAAGIAVGGPEETAISVVGWGNHLPDGVRIPAGTVVPPEMRREQILAMLATATPGGCDHV
ncbi:MAG: glucose-1-phosphate adenylyltransferase, partial [Thermodesulfobacteriota bacterium]